MTKQSSETERAAEAVAHYMQRGTAFRASEVAARAGTHRVFSALMVEWKAGRLSGTIGEIVVDGRPESVFQPLVGGAR